jgi:hypothetical protein
MTYRICCNFLSVQACVCVYVPSLMSCSSFPLSARNVNVFACVVKAEMRKRNEITFPGFVCYTERLRWSRGSVLAFGTQVRGFKPGRSRRIFRTKKILSTPSFGGEVKPSVTCHALRHVKEPKSDVEVATFGKISGLFLAHSSTFRCWVR